MPASTKKDTLNIRQMFTFAPSSLSRISKSQKCIIDRCTQLSSSNDNHPIVNGQCAVWHPSQNHNLENHHRTIKQQNYNSNHHETSQLVSSDGTRSWIFQSFPSSPSKNDKRGSPRQMKSSPERYPLKEQTQQAQHVKKCREKPTVRKINSAGFASHWILTPPSQKTIEAEETKYQRNQFTVMPQTQTRYEPSSHSLQSTRNYRTFDSKCTKSETVMMHSDSCCSQQSETRAFKTSDSTIDAMYNILDEYNDRRMNATSVQTNKCIDRREAPRTSIRIIELLN